MALMSPLRCQHFKIDIKPAFLKDLCKACVLLNISKMCDKHVNLRETYLPWSLKSSQKLPAAKVLCLCNIWRVIGQAVSPIHTLCSIILYFAIVGFHHNEIEICYMWKTIVLSSVCKITNAFCRYSILWLLIMVTYQSNNVGLRHIHYEIQSILCYLLLVHFYAIKNFTI